MKKNQKKKKKKKKKKKGGKKKKKSKKKNKKKKKKKKKKKNKKKKKKTGMTHSRESCEGKIVAEIRARTSRRYRFEHSWAASSHKTQTTAAGQVK